MGMSRSATGAIMFLMKLFQACFDDIFEFVKTQRQETDPNEGFVEQLKIFESKKWMYHDETAVAVVEVNKQVEIEDKAHKLIQYAAGLPKSDEFCKALIARLITPQEDTNAEIDALVEKMQAKQLTACPKDCNQQHSHNLTSFGPDKCCSN